MKIGTKSILRMLIERERRERHREREREREKDTDYLEDTDSYCEISFLKFHT